MSQTPSSAALSRDRMFPLLVEASPDFWPQWRAFQSEWKSEPVETPYHLCLGDFARYLVDKLERGETKDFAAVFSVVERFHTEGDPYVQNAATIGLLEAIQNMTGRNAENWLPHLRPATRTAWVKLNTFWEGASHPHAQ